MPPTSLHGKALAWAESHLGASEIPAHSNTGAFVMECQAATWLGGAQVGKTPPAKPTTTGWAWCVAFFQKAWQITGFVMPWLGAGAYAFLDWAKTVGWVVKWEDAVPGDGVILNIGAGHMAMLAAPVDDAGNVPTISGNYGDKVAEHTFQIGQVRGFIHIPADKTAAPPEPVKPPVFEVVSSASGRKVIYVSGANAVGRNIARILNHHPAGVTIRRKTR